LWRPIFQAVPPIRVMRPLRVVDDDRGMLNDFSNQIADIVSRAASSVVQVHGRRRPASGVICGDDTVVTLMSVVGRQESVQVRRQDREPLAGELVGWDTATSIAVLRVPGLGGGAVLPAETEARVGQVAIAVARSWSNALTASAGIVSVIGGPLRTGRRRAIERVIRTSAPMHDGFAGGALLDANGALLGVNTAASIRGFGVVIPASIAWAVAARVVEQGPVRRGYLGLAGQSVVLPPRQRDIAGRDRALLVVGVSPDTAAAAAGVLVGDVLLAVDDRSIDAPEDLLDLLMTIAPGRAVTLRLLRGEAAVEIGAVVGERPRG
jgi:S1-C subfamily serine protease